MNKIALLTMDVEDWYNTSYIQNMPCLDKTYSMCDGIDNYLKILSKFGIKATFFVLLEMALLHEKEITEIKESKNEIGLHGYDHICPIDKTVNEFKEEIIFAKGSIENKYNIEIKGYRAPAYSLDKQRLDIIQNIGFLYDSSKIDSTANSLYGKLDLDCYTTITNGVFSANQFYEFEISTEKLLLKRFAIGGGFFRIFPWFFSKILIKKYIKNHNIFIFFIHPFELSSKRFPHVDRIGFKNYLRSHFGLGTVENKIIKMIKYLKKKGFIFMTYSEAIDFIKDEKNE